MKEKPLLLFDGDCAFCTREAARIVRWTGPAVKKRSFREKGALAGLGLSEAECDREIKLVHPGGRVSGGAEAIFDALSYSKRTRALSFLYRIPGVPSVAESVYAWVAARRYLFLGRTCPDGTCSHHRGEHEPPGDAKEGRYALSAALFLSALALLHLANFWSMSHQAVELIGAKGLEPAGRLLEAAKKTNPGWTYRDFPSVFWFDASDAAIERAAFWGMLVSVLAFLRVLPRLMFAAAYLLYLSFVLAGGGFFTFQWDSLILEATFMAMLLPMRSFLRARPERAPSGWAVWPLQFLLFKLHFLSGISKVLPGSKGWTDWTAMSAYYETAPLPTWGGWYMHHMGAGFQRFSTAATLVLEILLPFLIFAGPWGRRAVFAGLAAFQVMILLTANYGIFNYTALALCLFLIDDKDWETAGRTLGLRRLVARARTGEDVASWRLGWWRGALGRAACAVLLWISTVTIFGYITPQGAWTSPTLRPWLELINRWRVASQYHLFAGMTTRRVEVELEGSNDGKDWGLYTWKHKPQDPHAAPPFLAPYHPRLDFKMWFYPLNMNPAAHGYFNELVRQACADPPAACRHFKDCPFPEKPPRVVRVVAWDYKMATLKAMRTDGVWWTRTRLGLAGQPYLCNSQDPPRF